MYPCGTRADLNPNEPILLPSHLSPSRTQSSRPQESNLGKRQDRPAIAAQSEFPVATAVICCASGVLWGGAVLWSVTVGAQTGWTRSKRALAIIIMTSCVGAIGIEDLDRTSASERQIQHGVCHAAFELRLSIENSRLRYFKKKCTIKFLFF